jgi:hypothetical protein
VFQDQGVVVLKGALPAAVCGATHDFLAAALTGMAGLFARYGIALDAPDGGAEVARLLASPATVPPPRGPARAARPFSPARAA